MAKGRTPDKKEVPDLSQLKKHITKRLSTVKKLEKSEKTISKPTEPFDESSSKNKKLDMSGIKKNIEKKLKSAKAVRGAKTSQATELELTHGHEYIQTGITGFDDLVGFGIPKGSAILLAGGAGTGKTIFCLNYLANAAAAGERCLYLSFEESETRLKHHMEDFGWDWKKLEKSGNLRIVRLDQFQIATSLEAMIEKSRGELMIQLTDTLKILPKDYKPTRVVIDSISSIAAAFTGRDTTYRVFIEQLFRYLETIGATSILISETEQVPKKYSRTGVEEFLADGVVVMYNLRMGDVRINALEVLKLRGSKIKKKIVPFRIMGGKGIQVYPNEAILGETKQVV